MTRKFALALALAAIAATTAAGAAIHDAAAQGDLAAVKRLVKADPACLSARNARGRTPLHVACVEGKSDVVAFLLEKSVPIGQRDTAYQLTPLHFAALKGHVDVARLLLERGADLNAREMDNETPLFYAVAEGHLPMIEFLIARGADLNDTLSRVGNTVISLALDRGRPEVVKLLVEKGATTRMHPRSEFPATWTLMHTAAWGNDRALIDFLADHGVPVDQKSTGDRTPLHNACQQGNTESARALIARGADVNAATDGRATPLFFTVNRGDMPLARLLIESGARVDGRDSASGLTLLHYAAIKGYGDIAGLLIDKGVDATAKDVQGRTALDCAVRYGQSSCASLLRERGSTCRTKQEGQAPAPKSGQAVVWYLGHSGWAVRTSGHLLVFDHAKGERPPDDPGLANGSISPAELRGLKTIVLVSHSHGDHYTPAIFDWRKDVPELTYVLGFAPPDKEGFVQLANREMREVAGAEITTIESNDSGQGFLVKVDGITIFHPGDHANRKRDFSGPFKAEVDFLTERAAAVDIMFAPVNGCNFGDVEAVKQGVYYSIEQLHPRAVFPMHAGDGGMQYAAFAAEAKKNGIAAPIYVADFPGDHWRLNDH